MRKISANHILPISSAPLRNGIIRLDTKCRILELIDTGGRLHEESGLKFHNGIIIPGFVLPWLRLDDVAESVEELDRELIRNGIKGVGVILRENTVTNDGFERMRKSPLIYHPIIELCPEPGEGEFEVFNRGIDLASNAWNEFNLSCSLTSCPSAMEHSDLGKYLREYNSSHRHVSPPKNPIVNIQTGVPRQDPDVSLQPYSSKSPLNLMNWLPFSHPDKNLKELLPALTIDAAAAIFEDELLGSIEPGKQPGLNLITGLDPETLRPGAKTSLHVLV